MSLPFSIGSTRAGYQDVGDDVAVLDVNSCRAEDTGYTGNDGTKRRVSWQVRDANGTEVLMNTRSFSCKMPGTRCEDRCDARACTYACP